MIIYGVYQLSKNKAELDALNIFPVPDGDTGTNMSLTAQAAALELKRLEEGSGCDKVGQALASGSLRGARGNSGVILSQLFRGLSKGMKNKDEITTADFAYALKLSQETAYKAVMKPKEGTVLTVARETAEKALELAETVDDFERFFEELIAVAYRILSKTQDMLPALKAAKVVDAGGKGLVYIYEGMYEGLFKEAPDIELLKGEMQKSYSPVIVYTQHIEFGYCTEFFIESKAVTETQMNSLTQFLLGIGDSVVAVNDDELVKIHVHSNNPGTILEYALKIGPLSNIKIENMRIQHTSNVAEKTTVRAFAPIVDKTNKDIGIIAVSSGEGINNIFLDLGCDDIITGGQTMNPSTDDILMAIEAIDKKSFIILPNNKNIILSAKQAADIAQKELGKSVCVLETKTVTEGICAMIAMVQGKSLNDTADIMREAADCVRTGHVTKAVRDTEIDGKVIKQGDYLGLIDGVIEVMEEESFLAARKIIDIFMDDCEIISIYYGEDGNEDEGRRLCQYLEDNGIEHELQYGGQPVYSYIISAE